MPALVPELSLVPALIPELSPVPALLPESSANMVIMPEPNQILPSPEDSETPLPMIVLPVTAVAIMYVRTLLSHSY